MSPIIVKHLHIHLPKLPKREPVKAMLDKEHATTGEKCAHKEKIEIREIELPDEFLHALFASAEEGKKP